MWVLSLYVRDSRRDRRRIVFPQFIEHPIFLACNTSSRWWWKQSLNETFFVVTPATLHMSSRFQLLSTGPDKPWKEALLISPPVSAPSSVLLLKRCCLSDQSPPQCHLRCGVLIDHEIIQKAPQPAPCSLKVSSDSSSKVHPSVW